MIGFIIILKYFVFYPVIAFEGTKSASLQWYGIFLTDKSKYNEKWKCYILEIL